MYRKAGEVLQQGVSGFSFSTDASILTSSESSKTVQTLPIKASFGKVYGNVSGKVCPASIDASLLLAFIACAGWSSLRRLWRHFTHKVTQ